MERECEITLLTYEQILGKKKLKIFNKIDDWKIGIRPALTFSKNLFIPKKKIGINF